MKVFQHVLIALCLLSTSAFAIPKVEVFKIQNGKKQPTNLQFKTNWNWKKSGTSEQLYLRLDFNTSKKPRKIAVAHGKWLRKKKPSIEQTILLTGQSNQFQLLYEDGTKERYLVKIANETNWLQARNCREFGVSLKSKSTETIPFYVGLSCENKNSAALITLSFPDETEWGTANIPETAGKAERWKLYRFDDVDGVAIVRPIDFTVLYKKKNFGFRLESTFSQIIPNPEKISPDLGIGFSYLTLSVAGTKRNSIQPEIYASIHLRRFFAGLRPGGSFRYALPFALSGETQGYYQFEGFLGRPFLLGGKITLDPRAYFSALGIDYNPIAVVLRHNQVGVGLNIGFKLSKSAIYFTALASGQLASSASSFISLRFGYDFNVAAPSSYGVRLDYQSVSATVSGSSDRQFSQINANFVLRL